MVKQQHHCAKKPVKLLILNCSLKYINIIGTIHTQFTKCIIFTFQLHNFKKNHVSTTTPQVINKVVLVLCAYFNRCVTTRQQNLPGNWPKLNEAFAAGHHHVSRTSMTWPLNIQASKMSNEIARLPIIYGKPVYASCQVRAVVRFCIKFKLSSFTISTDRRGLRN